MTTLNSHSRNNLKKDYFGVTKHNEEVSLYTLNNKNGIEAKISNFGATLYSLFVPTKNGKTDVVLGFNSLNDYIESFEKEGSPYFSAIVGRIAGRIKNAQFPLNGKTVMLDRNHGKHHLHGGKYQLSNVAWNFENYNPETNSITFSYLSKENEFYPGDVSIEVIYQLSDDNSLSIKYKATATEDTPLNLTNHAYFNLDSQTGSVLEQKLTVNADKFLELDQDSTPTGKFIEVENHPFDFRKSKNVIRGIDNCFVLKNNTEPCAVLRSEKNDLTMKVFTDQPSVQIYVGGKTAEGLNNKNLVKYHTESGICFETQLFPDSPNHEHFTDIILRKGKTYQQNTSFQFILS